MVLKGFRVAQAGVWGAVLRDAVEFEAILFGLKLFKRKGRRFRHFMELFGAAVLFFFGAYFLFNVRYPSSFSGVVFCRSSLHARRLLKKGGKISALLSLFPVTAQRDGRK